MDSPEALGTFAAKTCGPVCASETIASRWEHRNLLESGASAIVMPDIVWCGGLSEARKIAAMADAYHRPVAPHDCTGPVAFMAAVHLSLNVPNALLQESVRAFYSGWYRELVTQVPAVEDGHIGVPEGVGLGTDLQPGLEHRPDATVVVSS